MKERHHRISPEPPPLSERVRDLLGARDLFVLLLRRELQVRYKQTALGVGWIVLQPLVPAVLLAIVFGAFARLPSAGSPYFLFALSGFVLYQFFASAVNRTGASLIKDAGLITKVYFPRAVLPLANGAAGVVDFVIGLTLLLVLALLSGRPFTATVLLVPVIASATLVMAIGIGMGVAALNAHFRDFGYVVPFALQVLLYGSPVMYSLELVPREWQDVIAVNPLVGLIEAFRWSVLGTAAPSSTHVLAGLTSGAALVVVGLVVFNRASRDMTDVV